MEIKATEVKKLRDKTGAGMLNCKQALVATEGNIEAAIDWLRKKGLSAAAKKAGRVAAEGLTAITVEGLKAAAIELNSETDFVSKNEQFQKLVREVAQLATKVSDLDALKAMKCSSGKTVEEEITENVATIGENLNLRRMQSINVNQGVISSYTHNAVAPNLGRIAVLVAIESDGDKTRLEEVGKDIAMHIAASRPLVLNRESVDPALIEKERSIFVEQSKASGKPEAIIEKMTEGRIRKYLEEIVLLEQTFIKDQKKKVSEIIDDLAKELGTKVELAGFVRLEIGEGIEKAETNFADEVAAVAGQN